MTYNIIFKLDRSRQSIAACNDAEAMEIAAAHGWDRVWLQKIETVPAKTRSGSTARITYIAA